MDGAVMDQSVRPKTPARQYLFRKEAGTNRDKICAACPRVRLLKQRPDIGAAVAADRANETLFQIGQPHVIGLRRDIS